MSQVRRFLDHHLRHALAHCEARRQALEDSIAKLPWVDTLLWLDPALLPKVEEEEVKEEEVPRSRRGDRPKLENSSSMEEPKRVKLTKAGHVTQRLSLEMISIQVPYLYPIHIQYLKILKVI